MVWQSLFRGFIQVHILHHAQESPVYGSWLIDELARHGYSLSPGTLYPILHRLEEDGLLKSSHKVVEGKRRRYYVITPLGMQALDEARRQAIELAQEIAPAPRDWPESPINAQEKLSKS
jgi:PadR family transcriptional regulator, regulatory protein PadR